MGLFSIRYPEGSGEGSYRYKGNPELIDEILVPSMDAWMYRSQQGAETIGFVGDFFVGSDHKLLWVELNW